MKYEAAGADTTSCEGRPDEKFEAKRGTGGKVSGSCSGNFMVARSNLSSESEDRYISRIYI